MTGRRPCFMCSRLCWRCEEEFYHLRNELEGLKTECATLRLAYAEADDRDAPVLSDKLAEVQDAIDETAAALTAMEEGEP